MGTLAADGAVAEAGMAVAVVDVAVVVPAASSEDGPWVAIST